ncbi:hypothetical protein GCM10011579_094090 [Streptomyces albiflavescens]|uniref:Uncharacterized protein n=1 Tax=Streptomyces albiflavescens TaxID=1623582 RepID=A0A917YHM1_9ACTN|nr:hypothetical protein [Streptomyces albiflavescens]GGN94519.1 hypothetical protein GCM10011579_094090 [Streptomyces albiflavescens]
MTHRQRPLDLERLRHAPGQLLRTRDLRDQLARDAEVRWWHHRALHTGLGVVEGMAVRLSKDGRSVKVEPGTAYDNRGREVLVTAPVTLALPTGPATLVARLRTPGPGRPDRVTVTWRDPKGATDPCEEGAQGATDPCGEVVLAVLAYDPRRRPQLTSAPTGRDQAPPYLGFGTTPADGTVWESWEPSELSVFEAGPLGIQVAIDTTAAGFDRTPCYFAWLQWPAPQAPALFPPLIRTAQSYVEEPTPGGFLVRVALSPRLRPPQGLPLPGRDVTAQSLLRLARAQRLSVAWLGIGHREGT